MKQAMVVDIRNVYRPDEMAAGFVDESVGRGKLA
jgi:hypothetical protein